MSSDAGSVLDPKTAHKSSRRRNQIQGIFQDLEHGGVNQPLGGPLPSSLEVGLLSNDHYCKSLHLGVSWKLWGCSPPYGGLDNSLNPQHDVDFWN